VIIDNNDFHNINRSIEFKKSIKVDKILKTTTQERNENSDIDIGKRKIEKKISIVTDQSNFMDKKWCNRSSSITLAYNQLSGDDNNDSKLEKSNTIIQKEKKEMLCRDETLLNNDYQQEESEGDYDISVQSTTINNPKSLTSEKKQNSTQIIILKDDKDDRQDDNYCIQLRKRKHENYQLLEIKINDQIISERNLNEFDTTGNLLIYIYIYYYFLNYIKLLNHHIIFYIFIHLINLKK